MKKYLFLTLVFLTLSFQGLGQEVYENKKFYFSMQQPNKWFIANNKELLDNLNKIELTEESLAKFVSDSKEEILLTGFYKYNPKTKTGLIPTIQIRVRANKTKNFQSFKSDLIKSSKSFNKYFEDFGFIEEPKEIEISGIKSVVFVFQFTMKTQYNQILKVRSRAYAIPQKSYFFQINFTDGQTEEDCTKEFDELVKTIKIGK